jgi:hypothetical protein
MINDALMTLLLLIFSVGVLGFYANRATRAQQWRGLATMGLSLAGMMLILFERGLI